MAFASKNLLRSGSRGMSNYLSGLMPNIGVQAARYLSVSTVFSAKGGRGSDPIQQLFLDKIRDYEQKKKASGGRLVDASPEQQKALDEEMQRLLRQYGGKHEDEMHQYPPLQFKDVEYDPISVQVEPDKQQVDPEVVRKELLAMKRVEEDIEDTKMRDRST